MITRESPRRPPCNRALPARPLGHPGGAGHRQGLAAFPTPLHAAEQLAGGARHGRTGCPRRKTPTSSNRMRPPGRRPQPPRATMFTSSRPRGGQERMPTSPINLPGLVPSEPDAGPQPLGGVPVVAEPRDNPSVLVQSPGGARPRPRLTAAEASARSRSRRGLLKAVRDRARRHDWRPVEAADRTPAARFQPDPRAGGWFRIRGRPASVVDHDRSKPPTTWLWPASPSPSTHDVRRESQCDP